MKRSAMLEFESTAFAAESGEDEHTNPGIFGRALAHWLAERLPAKGVKVGAVFAEDFGWCIPVEAEHGATYIACSNAGEEKNVWRVFAFSEVGIVARLFGKAPKAQVVAATFEAVKQLLQSESSIRRLHEVEK